MWPTRKLAHRNGIYGLKSGTLSALVSRNCSEVAPLVLWRADRHDWGLFDTILATLWALLLNFIFLYQRSTGLWTGDHNDSYSRSESYDHFLCGVTEEGLRFVRFKFIESFLLICLAACPNRRLWHQYTLYGGVTTSQKSYSLDQLGQYSSPSFPLLSLRSVHMTLHSPILFHNSFWHFTPR